MQGGPMQQADCVYSLNTEIKQPKGKAFVECILGGKRSVFAWFNARELIIDDVPDIPDNAVRIRFNPKMGDCFFHAEGIGRVDFLREAWGSGNGECWGVL